MSPSTGVIQFLAKHSEEFGVVVEQAEDEISAINMVYGLTLGQASPTSRRNFKESY